MTENLPSALTAANSVKVSETLIDHCLDVFYWIDQGSHELATNRTRINRHLIETFIAIVPPTAIKSLSKSGACAVWLKNSGTFVEGIANDADVQFPAPPNLTITIEVIDPLQQFLPRRAQKQMGSGDGIAIGLFKAPHHINFNSQGGIYGQIKNQNGDVIPWAVINLQVEIVTSSFVNFSAQTNHLGEFRLSLKRLPPLPESVNSYSAALSVKANVNAGPSTYEDFENLPDVNVRQPDSNSFSSTYDLQLVPGETKSISSFEQNHLTITTT